MDGMRWERRTCGTARQGTPSGPASLSSSSCGGSGGGSAPWCTYHSSRGVHRGMRCSSGSRQQQCTPGIRARQQRRTHAGMTCSRGGVGTHLHDDPGRDCAVDGGQVARQPLVLLAVVLVVGPHCTQPWSGRARCSHVAAPDRPMWPGHTMQALMGCEARQHQILGPAEAAQHRGLPKRAP